MVSRDKIYEIQERINRQRDRLDNEEKTRLSLIIPFFQALGYDTYDPDVFATEYNADWGSKKHEKVDYAILDRDQPLILIEAKKLGASLDINFASQLGRYFGVTDAKIGILTDGLIYKFYSDLERENVMDHYPFYEINLLELDENDYEKLELYAAGNFAFDRAIQAGLEIKQLQALREFFWPLLTGETVDADFVRFVIKKIGFERSLTSAKIDRYTPLVINAMLSVIQEIDDNDDFRVELLETKIKPGPLALNSPPETNIKEPRKRNGGVKDEDRNLYAALTLAVVHDGGTLADAGRVLLACFPEVFTDNDGAKMSPATRHGTNAGGIITGRSWQSITGFNYTVTKYAERLPEEIEFALTRILPELNETEIETMLSAIGSSDLMDRILPG